MMYLKERINEIIEKSADRKLYIYGAGIWGKRILRFLQCMGKEIDGFIDNKKGCAIENYKMYRGEEIKNWSKGSYFIVISNGREEGIKEIKLELLNAGLTENQDFVVFSKFVENRSGAKEIKDYLFGWTRKYNVCGGGGYRGFRVFPSIQKDVHCKRVVVLGGSTSDPGYNTDVVNWTEWLSRILQKRDYCVEVFAGGIQGYASSQELLKLIRDVLILKPDIVISYSGINDATGIGMLENHPLMMQGVKYLVKDFADEVNYGLENTEDPVTVWCMNMKMMKSICQTLNISFLGILEPFPFYDTKGYKDKFAEAFFADNVQERIYRFYDAAVERVAGEYDILDLSSLMRGKHSLVYDYMHYDTDGNYIIADKIAGVVQQYL